MVLGGQLIRKEKTVFLRRLPASLASYRRCRPSQFQVGRMLEAFFYVVALAVFLFLLAGIALAALRATAQGASTAGKWPFNLKKPLSEPEQILYFRLCKALPDHIVLAQVGLSRFLGVKRGHPARVWNNRINRMSVDFLVCNMDASVLAAIELDDASHQRPDRESADAKKERALGAAGVRLLRWNVGSMPDEAAIHVAITSGSTASNRKLAPAPKAISANVRPA
jgi:hypothetical protein